MIGNNCGTEPRLYSASCQHKRVLNTIISFGMDPRCVGCGYRRLVEMLLWKCLRCYDLGKLNKRSMRCSLSHLSFGSC